jgi:hypothetical protein
MRFCGMSTISPRRPCRRWGVVSGGWQGYQSYVSSNFVVGFTYTFSFRRSTLLPLRPSNHQPSPSTTTTSPPFPSITHSTPLHSTPPPQTPPQTPPPPHPTSTPTKTTQPPKPPKPPLPRKNHQLTPNPPNPPTHTHTPHAHSKTTTDASLDGKTNKK